MSSHGPDGSDRNELVTLPDRRLPDEERPIEHHTVSSVQAGVQLQRDSDESGFQIDTSPEESVRFWADLKAETGYDSYADYLEVYEEINPHVKTLQEYLLDTLPSLENRDGQQTCAIFELHDECSPCPRINLQCYSSSEIAILGALRRPTATAAVRIVLWEASNMGKKRVNAFGLGLKLHPDFFRALLARHKGLILPFYSKGFESKLEYMTDEFDERRTAPEVVLINPYVVTIARQYLSGDQDTTPVIVIFNLDWQMQGLKKGDKRSNQTLPAQELVTRDVSDPMTRIPEWMQEYVRLLKLDLEKWPESCASDKDVSNRSLSPILYFYVFQFCEKCDRIRHEYLEFTLSQNKFRYDFAVWKGIRFRNGTGKIKRLEDLFEMRDLLRLMVEHSEDICQRLRRFRRSQKPCDTRQNEQSTTIEDHIQQARVEALRLETEIRDYLQLQTGQLALQESRKSIELSNSQIEEGKRVKIFTILAFVYIPLNLATSIFGMNIEQLNGNGQRLSAFIITAMVTLAVTGGSWFMIEQISSYRKWQWRSTKEQYDGKTQFSLAVRLALIVFLASHRHTHWMFRSGTWWRVIINHGSRLIGPYDGSKGSLTACEYVSRFCSWGNRVYPPYWHYHGVYGEAFTLDDLNDLSWRSHPRRR